MRNTNDLVFSAQSLDADVQSAAIQTSQAFAFTVQAVVTGTVAGTLKVQFSNDPITNGVAPTHWTDITSASVAISNAATYGINKIEIAATWIRLAYVSTSGTGATANVRINISGF